MKKKKLKSLEQNNSDRINAQNNSHNNLPQPNGIACPDCGTELMDSNPSTLLNIYLTSDLLQKSTHCPNSECGYIGYRIA